MVSTIKQSENMDGFGVLVYVYWLSFDSLTISVNSIEQLKELYKSFEISGEWRNSNKDSESYRPADLLLSMENGDLWGWIDLTWIIGFAQRQLRNIPEALNTLEDANETRMNKQRTRTIDSSH